MATSIWAKQVEEEQKKKQATRTAPTAQELAKMEAPPTINPATGKPYTSKQQEILTSQWEQLTGKKTHAEAVAEKEAKTGELLKKSKTIGRYTSQRPEAIQAQKEINLKYGLDPMTGLTGEPIDIPERDYEKEQAIASKLGVDIEGNEGGLYMATYPPQELSQMIEGGRVDPSVFTAQELAELGYTPEKLEMLRNSGVVSPEIFDKLMNKMQTLGTQLGIAQANLAETPAPTNQAMNVLSEALNMKSNFKNQKLGVSDLFTQAGLSGYEVLAQSLSQRSREMGQKARSAREWVFETGGMMADQYNAMASHAENLQKDFDKTMDRLLSIDKDYRDMEFAMDQMYKEAEIEANLLKYKEELKRETMRHEKELNPETVDNAESDNYGSGEYLVDPETGERRPVSQGEAVVGGKVYKKSLIAEIFNVGGLADWCGVFASTLSTAPKVGNTWAEKRTKITHRDNPTAGDKMLTPLGAETDASGYGHVATVLSFNPETREVWVVESNRGGEMNRGAAKGKVTFGTYNIDKMQTEYGDNWGFAKGDFKASIKEAFNKAGGLDLAPIPSAIYKAASGDIAGSTLELLANLPKSVGEWALAKRRIGESGKSWEQRYFDATGDERVFNPSSTIAKDLAQMSPENIEKLIQNKIIEKEGEAPEAMQEIEYLYGLDAAIGELEKGKSLKEIRTELEKKYVKSDVDRIMDELLEIGEDEEKAKYVGPVHKEWAEKL